MKVNMKYIDADVLLPIWKRVPLETSWEAHSGTFLWDYKNYLLTDARFK